MDSRDDATRERPKSTGVPGSGSLPLREHVLMVNDLARGRKYRDAMKAKIRPGDVVLEVGTGAGLLSCLAAQLGAKHVYSVEQSPLMYGIAKKVIEANGLSDKITLLNVHSKDLVALKAIKEPIDVFVTETIGTHGLDEGILLIIDDVKSLFSSRVKMIPETVSFEYCLVNLSGIREQTQILYPILGIDLSALNAELATSNLLWPRPIDPWREMSTTVETPTYDLLDFKPEESVQKLEVTQDNVCDGILSWGKFRLADAVVLDTRYRDFGSSWPNSVHLMERVLIARGQICTSKFRLDEDRLKWTLNWSITDR